ncbi:MAG: hypothetical protein K9M57_06025 [Phycisphaerae bacterium]|nr:hypothetical protein [Phycisphaerae bacterium]
MKPSDPIEQSVKGMDITASKDMHDRVLGKLLNEMDESEQNPKAVNRPVIWRTIMKSKMTKYATAAIVIVGIFVGLKMMGVEPDGATPAFGIQDVIDAMKKVECYHMVCSAKNVGFSDEETNARITTFTSTEAWGSIDNTFFISKNNLDGSIIYKESITDCTYSYDPKLNTITKSYDGHVNENISGTNFIDSTIQSVEKACQQAEGTIKYTDEILDGRKVKVITAILPHEIQSVIKIYVDDQKYRISKISLVQTNDEGQGGELIFDVDYPDICPSDIYEAGAPRDARIIDTYSDTRPSDKLKDLLEKHKTHQNSRLKRLTDKHIVVKVREQTITPTKYYYETKIYQRNGNHSRESRMAKKLDHKLVLKDDFDYQYNLWQSYNEAQTVKIKDDIYQYTLERVADLSQKWRLSNKRKKSPLFKYSADLWRSVISSGTSSTRIVSKKIIEDEYSKKHNLVCIEIKTKGWDDGRSSFIELPERCLCYLNPQKDYLCHRRCIIQEKDAPWQNDQTWLDDVDPKRIPKASMHVNQILEYATTKTGVLYARKTGSIPYEKANVADIDLNSIATSTTTIYLNENPTFQEGIFSVDTLIKSNDQ